MNLSYTTVCFRIYLVSMLCMLNKAEVVEFMNGNKPAAITYI